MPNYSSYFLLTKNFQAERNSSQKQEETVLFDRNFFLLSRSQLQQFIYLIKPISINFYE